jgi:16S rRNA (adenine1518-N6/adenine1519-N6)-dimethyltransferase
VELDGMLVPVLKAQFALCDTVAIHQGDILRCDLYALLAPYEGMRLKVVANLPYYVTTPVVMHLLENGPLFASFTVMVQREVAERMAASPGAKDYGALSLAVRYYADAHIAAYVPPNCFMPRPNVDSAVAHLQVLPAPRCDTDKTRLFAIIRAAFGQRRKTLVNALYAGAGRSKYEPAGSHLKPLAHATGAIQKNAPGGVFPALSKEDIAKALTLCGLPTDVRGEALTLEDFARVADALKTNYV